MYCAYNEDKNIIAFHDKKKPVEIYIENVYKYNKLVLDIGKINKKKSDVLENIGDLYLVRYGETFVQSGYLIYIQISSNQECEDNEFARDILYRILETRQLKEKKVKQISKAISILEDIIYDDESYTPSLDQLRQMKLSYDPYLYNIGLPRSGLLP